MLLGGKPGERTVIDERTPNQISEAAKAPSPKDVARARRTRLASPEVEHVDTISVPFWTSESS